MIDRILGDDSELVLAAHLILHLVGHDGAAETCAHDHDVSHLFLSLVEPLCHAGGSHCWRYYIMTFEYVNVVIPTCDELRPRRPSGVVRQPGRGDLCAVRPREFNSSP